MTKGTWIIGAFALSVAACGGSGPSGGSSSPVATPARSTVNLTFSGAIAGVMTTFNSHSQPQKGDAGSNGSFVLCGPQTSGQFPGSWAARFNGTVGKVGVGFMVIRASKFKGAGAYSDVSASRLTLPRFFSKALIASSGNIHVEGDQSAVTVDLEFRPTTGAPVHVTGSLHC